MQSMLLRRGGVVIALALTAHRHLEAVLSHRLLIVVRTVLAATAGMMEEPPPRGFPGLVDVL